MTLLPPVPTERALPSVAVHQSTAKQVSQLLSATIMRRSEISEGYCWNRAILFAMVYSHVLEFTFKEGCIRAHKSAQGRKAQADSDVAQKLITAFSFLIGWLGSASLRRANLAASESLQRHGLLNRRICGNKAT